MNEELEKGVLPYHEPDFIWQSFQGVTDFESFIEKFVMPGRFHQGVPEAIVKSYRIAEHIIAHSWYHYPVIDEALVKLLRTMELAVKLRCEQLGIPLHAQDKKSIKRKKQLNGLIDELKIAEPDKDIVEILHWLRGVRNYLMHPERETLVGAIAFNHIRQCLIMYNALFLSNEVFQRSKVKLGEMQSLLKELTGYLCVLEHTGFRYIVYEADVVEAYEVNNKWHFLFAAKAVPNDFAAMLANDCFPSSIVYTITDIQISNNKISGKVISCGELFILSKNTHPQNVETFTLYKEVKNQMNEHQVYLFQMANNSAIASGKTTARMNFWSEFSEAT